MKKPRKVVAAVSACCGLLAATTAGPAMASSAPVSVFAEPQAGAAPVVQLIDAARHSIDLEIYELTDGRVIQSLERARKRGVDVRVLLNRKDPFEKSSPNQAAYATLERAGVAVRWAPPYLSLTHEKALTVDANTAAILTLNLVGEYSSTRDFGVIDRQPADVAAIDQTFDADWSQKRATAPTGAGDLVWSPGAASVVMRLIESAQTSIDLENEEMDYRDATGALCAAARRGVTVKVVMTYDSEWKRAFGQLEACGAHVHVFHGQAYYIHAKVLLVDGRTALVGSQNLSTESLVYNRELSITLTAPTVVSELSGWFDADYAKAEAY